MTLGGAEGFGVHDVELDVMPVEGEIGSDEMHQFVQPFVIFQQLRREFLVEQRAAGADVVHLRHGADGGGRSVRVGALNRRDALRKRLAAEASVRRRAGDRAEVDMHGGGEKIDVIFPAFGVGTPVNGGKVGFEDAAHERIGVVVVVAVARRAVDENLPQPLVFREIAAERGEEGFHRDVTFVVNVVAHRAHRVRHRADADALNVGRVVARAAVVVILAFGDAVVNEEGEKRRRHVARVEPLDDVVAANLDIDKIAELRLEGGEEFVESGKFARVAGLRSQLLAGARVVAVVEGNFQHFGHIEVAGEIVIFLPECADFHAARRAAAARVFDAFAHADEFLHNQIGVEDGRLPVAGADDFRRAFDESIGILFAHLNRGGGLQQPHLFDDIQQEIRDLVHAVRAVLEDAADVDLREIGVGAALLCGDADFGRRGLVVEFDPQALQQFFGRVARQRAFFQAFAVEGQKMTVEMPRAERIPGVEFGRDAEMDEPVVLQRFPKIARRVRGDVTANLRHAVQFGAAGFIFGFLRGSAEQFRVAFRIADERARRDAHGFEFFLFGVGFGVVEIIQRSERGVYFRLKIQHPFAVNFVVQNRMSRRALLHEFGEDARVVGVLPFGRHLAEDAFPHGFSVPKRDDAFFVTAEDGFIHFEGDFFPLVENFQVFERVAAQFGIRRRGFGTRSLFADDEFPFAQPERFVFQQVGECHRALHRRGIRLNLLLPIKLGEQSRALAGEGFLGVQTLLAQFLDSRSHGHEISPELSRFHAQPRRAEIRRAAPQRVFGRGARIGEPICPAQRFVFCFGDVVVAEQFHIVAPRQRGEKFGGRAEIFFIIVDAGNHRHTHQYLRARLGEPPQIVQNGLVRDSGVCLVLGGIHQLQIVEKEIGVGEDAFQRSPGDMPAGIHNGVQFPRFAGLQQRQQKLALQQRLSAGNGHAAAGLVVKRNIPLDFRHHLGDGHLPPGDFQCVVDAGLGAVAAVIAAGAVQRECTVERKRVLRTNGEAVAAARAAIFPKQDLRMRHLAFGVMTPPAAQRAAFEEDGRADARTIVDGVIFDVKNHAAFHASLLKFWSDTV